jgi:hypothetical protein
MDMMPITAWDKYVKEGGWEILDFNGKWIPLTASVRPNECRPHGARGSLGYTVRRASPPRS